ncbi:MAG TPA: sigma-70 family RNA polymerase sigma factor [Baekduia sp.]|uniref:RNA polymerase sigma factor n=1 Tax=Baekduia sp. TaxID=2600305 RepID=UPI002D798B67|nr:sigma-70 family RNA polymerase sigma factor [Baekduia sp.]HET6509663.1 sigma-70 family RNA polymerase sigma factor [Baekduia sp.]
MAVDALPPALPPSMLAGMGDDTLVGLIAAGSDDAFAALDERYRRRLVRFARGFVPGGQADAEDVVQEAMVRAVRALRNGSRPESLGPWLHRITRNCALDLTASRRRHPVVELADHAHPPTEDAEAAVERSMGVRGLVADVGRLPDTQRSALVLRELEGRSYVDIADELNVTVPAVKSLLVRARAGLKRARDDRRVAAWMPLPLLGRLVERVSTLWEPVAASATPKVACAAVVVAGSLPVVSGGTAATPHAPKSAKTPAATAAVVHRATATAAAPTTPPPAKTTESSAPAKAPVAHDAAPVTIPDGLRQDCADGTIDQHWSQAVLRAAIARSGSWTGEYGSCRQALLQASWGD